MLDGITFGSAGGIVSNGHGEPEAVAELGLQFGFPGAGTATVAAASIGEDEQLAAAAVAVSAVALPPAGDGVGGKGCRVMGDAYEDRAAKVKQEKSTAERKVQFLNFSIGEALDKPAKPAPANAAK